MIDSSANNTEKIQMLSDNNQNSFAFVTVSLDQSFFL